MIELTKDEINLLISQYLEEEGYYYTLFTFKHEVSVLQKKTNEKLHSLLTRGLQYMYGLQHMKGNQIIACQSKFSVSEEHKCDSTSAVEYKEETVLKSPPKMEKQIEWIEKPLAGVKEGRYACWSGDYLALYCTSGELMTFHFGNFLWKKKVESATSLAWKNEDLALGNKSGEIITINVSNSRTRSYLCHTGPVTQLKLKGRGILSSGVDGKIVVMGDTVKDITVSKKDAVTNLAWMDDEKVGYSLSNNKVGIVNLLDDSVFSFTGHKDRVTNLTFRNEILVSSSVDRNLGLWNTETMQGTYIDAKGGAVNDHKWIGFKLVSACSEGFIRLWDLERKVFTFELKHPGSFTVLDCSSSLIAAGTMDGTVIFADTRCNEVLKYSVASEVTGLAFSPTGTDICICGLGIQPKTLNLRFKEQSTF